jgi:uncharacterized protein
MTDLLTAAALVLVIEGLLYAAFPEQMKRMLTEALALPSGNLRLGGIVAAALGVLAVWLIRG